MHSYRSRVRTFLKPFAWPIALTMILCGIEELISLIIPWVQGHIFDLLSAHNAHNQTTPLIVGLGVVLIFSQVTSRYQWRVGVFRLDQPLRRHVQKISIERLTALSISQHISQNSGVRKSTITQGEGAVRSLVETFTYQIIPLILQVAWVTGLLVLMAPELAAILITGVVIFVTWAVRMNLRIMKPLLADASLRDHEDAYRGERLRNIELVLHCAQEQRTVRETDASVARVHQSHRALWEPYNNECLLRDSVIVITRVLIMFAGVRMVQGGAYSIGSMITFWVWTVTALNRIGSAGPITRALMEELASLRKYLELLETAPEIQVSPSAKRPERYRGDIEFDNVTLRYQRLQKAQNADDEERVVDDSLAGVSFHLKPGDKVAFVGESGAGKSSIVYALMMSQKLQDGRILIDGRNLSNELDYRHWRSRVGLVSQSTFLFDESLAYNMTYPVDVPSEDLDARQLLQAARMARVDLFAKKMSEGYQTRIGERGLRLSGGQRQRVGIARAIMSDPDVLILDEATSSLDPPTEADVMADIDQLCQGKTTIIIAHRYSTIRTVNRIYVMASGRIVGCGNHQELMSDCPEYRALLKHQQ